MSVGLVGRKCGMTRIFSEEGVSIPVTVIEVEPNRVLQVKTVEADGYTALQVTTGTQKVSRLNGAILGHCAKAKVEPGRGCWEFRVDQIDEGIAVGTVLRLADLFKEGQYVDVSAFTKGKGFAGTVKRWHFRTQDATHGNSLSHRVPGSTGQNQSPGRVFKGKKMAGHLGNVRRTIQNQQIIRVDDARNLLLIKGNVPGAPGGNVIVRYAVKKGN